MSESGPPGVGTETPSAAGAPTSHGRTARSFGERLVGALKLEADVYEEIEHDPSALGQAAGVVALGALAQGLAFVHVGFGGVVGGIVAGLIGWVLATAVVWAIGVKLMDHTSDFSELLRTLGFASAPKVLMVIGLLPIGPLRGLLSVAVAILTLVAFLIAVRQALDVSTGRAAWVCVLAVLASMALLLLVG
jgi:hypothetical protein